MSDPERYQAEVSICGLYDWWVCSPLPEVLFKFQSVGGRRREWKINLPSLTRKDTKTRTAEQFEQRLRRTMYPVLTEYHLSLHTLDGDPIPAPLAVTPNFAFEETARVERWDSEGRKMVWIGQPYTQAHAIDFGEWDGHPLILTVPAHLWPSTIFLVGNNQVRAVPLTNLNIDHLRDLAQKFLAWSKEFAQYENAYCFMTGSQEPPGVPGLTW